MFFRLRVTMGGPSFFRYLSRFAARRTRVLNLGLYLSPWRRRICPFAFALVVHLANFWPLSELDTEKQVPRRYALVRFSVYGMGRILFPETHFFDEFPSYTIDWVDAFT